MHTYGLRSRYDRLRQRGMLNKKEMADRLGIHEQTVDRGRNVASSERTPTTTTDGNSMSCWARTYPLETLQPMGDRLVDRTSGVQPISQRAGLEPKEV